MFKTTITDEQNKLGLGVDKEINIEVSYDDVKARGQSWGYRGGSPAEPAHVEILHVRVVDAPQSLEADIIDVFGDQIEAEICEYLEERDRAHAEGDY